MGFDQPRFSYLCYSLAPTTFHVSEENTNHGSKLGIPHRHVLTNLSLSDLFETVHRPQNSVPLPRSAAELFSLHRDEVSAQFTHMPTKFNVSAPSG